ncbi:MAG: hypothetical protein WCI74_02590 [Actinomycetes bacterium]
MPAWVGLPYTQTRSKPLKAVLSLAKPFIKLTENEARALMVHCAQEMAHLATFLPALHAQFQNQD